jgi:hypothetical protein
MEASLPDRVAAYLDAPDPARFDDLALAAYAFQVRHGVAQARLAARRGIDPIRLTHWRQIPPVPAAAYKAADLGLTGWPAQATFRSSGTTAAERSVHAHPFLDLYRRTIDLAFPTACLPDGGAGRTPILALVPRPDTLPDSSLSFMADHVIARWGAPESAWVLGPSGIDQQTARRFVVASGDRPVLLFTTAFALADLLDGLADERLPLPEGSVIMETGGFKGRRHEISRADLLARVEGSFAVPPNRVVREYGMTELTSQLYTRVLAGGDPEVFFPPPWMRLHTLDPTTLDDTPTDTPGLVAFLDLANLSSAVHLVTEDWGTLTPDGGLVLHGRAPGAELRGCSLTAEELVGQG